MVCVSQTWGKAIQSKVPGKRVSLEDCARGYWKLARSVRKDKAKWLMAFDKGGIVGVWKIGDKGWMRCEESPKKTWPEDLDGLKDCVASANCCPWIGKSGTSMSVSESKTSRDSMREAAASGTRMNNCSVR